jgi:hypothetical protein
VRRLPGPMPPPPRSSGAITTNTLAPHGMRPGSSRAAAATASAPQDVKKKHCPVFSVAQGHGRVWSCQSGSAHANDARNSVSHPLHFATKRVDGGLAQNARLGHRPQDGRNCVRGVTGHRHCTKNRSLLLLCTSGGVQRDPGTITGHAKATPLAFTKICMLSRRVAQPKATPGERQNRAAARRGAKPSSTRSVSLAHWLRLRVATRDSRGFVQVGFVSVQVDMRGSGKSPGCLFDEHAKQELSHGVQLVPVSRCMVSRAVSSTGSSCGDHTDCFPHYKLQQ